MKSHISMQGDNRKQEEVRANLIIEEIQKVVDREFEKGNIKSKAMYLEAMKKGITNTYKIDGKTKKYLVKMINERIKEEIYYEQVEHFTNGFEFLSEYPELIDATSGHRKEKFTDREAYNRFCDLRIKLQGGLNEYSQVNRILEDDRINDTDKRILEARKSVMDKEMARKREIEGR